MTPSSNQFEIVLYTTPNGTVKIDTLFQDETITCESALDANSDYSPPYRMGSLFTPRDWGYTAKEPTGTLLRNSGLVTRFDFIPEPGALWLLASGVLALIQKRAG